MCLATLGKIKKIKRNNIAEVDFNGVFLDVNIELVEAKIGDWVMAHAGFAIQRVEMRDAEEIIKLKM